MVDSMIPQTFDKFVVYGNPSNGYVFEFDAMMLCRLCNKKWLEKALTQQVGALQCPGCGKYSSIPFKNGKIELTPHGTPLTEPVISHEMPSDQAKLAQDETIYEVSVEDMLNIITGE